MAENESDDEWEVVPIDTPHSPAQNNTRSNGSSRALLELRISIGFRQWNYSSHARHQCRGDTINLPCEINEEALLEKPPLQQKQSFLFQLPVEIRLYIYELVFILSPEVKMTFQSNKSSQHGRYSVLALLETCRLVLYEAETIFYSINRLQIDQVHIPSSLSSRRREPINALAIVGNKSTAVWTHIETLHLVPNLQSLYFVSPTESLRFVDVYSWKLMLRQMEMQLRKSERLKEVKVLWNTSAPNMPEPGEMDRILKLAEIAKRLEACVATS